MHFDATALLIVLNFAAIGALPLMFFKRDGRFNLMWWLTALPFYLSAGSILLATPLLTGFAPARNLIAVGFSATSIFMLGLTLGSHRIPIALWHQSNDAPQHIVTWGAYRYVRHPFYASFLLAFCAAALYSPQAFTLGSLIYGFAILNTTAAREEAKLARSDFGSEYRDYVARTGRFFPRLRSV